MGVRLPPLWKEQAHTMKMFQNKKEGRIFGHKR
jgi:hypothetical protein